VKTCDGLNFVVTVRGDQYARLRVAEWERIARRIAKSAKGRGKWRTVTVSAEGAQTVRIAP
jgi:hypothetical protein